MFSTRDFLQSDTTVVPKKTTTEDAIPTNLLVVPLNITASLTAHVVLTAIARGTDVFKAVVSFSWNNPSGLVEISGAAEGDVVSSYKGAWRNAGPSGRPKVQAAFAGGEAIIQVVGVALTPIKWSATITLAQTD
jgi:hypothetical protein